jgi:hypothetical protein
MKGQKGGIPFSDFPDDHDVVLLGHELGNVLNGLLGMAELLGESGLNAEQNRWLKAIEHSGRQMQALITAVRSFEAGSGSNIEPNNVRTDGVELLEQVVISHTPAAASRNNRLWLVTEADLPRYWNCDSCLVRQLLDNLVGNAIKFTRAGEVVIEAAAVPASGTTGDTLEFRVSDSGRGLGTSADEQVFGAYQQSCPGSEGQTGNRGLGLFICRNIVLALGGSIACSSPSGGGACFKITLPQALTIRGATQPVFRSSLLTQIWCQLKLQNPLRRSVENILTRLSVRWSKYEPTASPKSGEGLVLVICDPGKTEDKHIPGLVLTPRPVSGSVLPGRVLDAPVLESSLAPLLLEIALQWRSLEISNEIPG